MVNFSFNAMRPDHRKIVEAIKCCNGIQIDINPGTDSELLLRFREDKKLQHDIALAIQTYFINKEKNDTLKIQGSNSINPYNRIR